MAVNPNTNQIEKLTEKAGEEILKKMIEQKAEILIEKTHLLRPNGKPVPKHWSVFTIDEEIVIKDYTFKVAYMNESSITFEPVRPVIIDSDKKE